MFDWAQELYRIRKDRGYTKKKAAELLGVSVFRYSNWERGVLPTEDTRDAIYRVFGIPTWVFPKTNIFLMAQLMEAKRMSITRLAMRVGVTQQSASCWLAGKTLPSPDKRRVIARVLGSTVRELFHDGAPENIDF